jgi:hypothetical protein
MIAIYSGESWIGAILGYSLLILFFGVLFITALAMDGYFDTWLMFCHSCGKQFKAKKVDRFTVDPKCIFCGSSDTDKIKDVGR